MDNTRKYNNPNPCADANFISRLFFWWLNDFFSKGRKKSLEIEDLYNVLPQDSSEKLGNDLEREWQKELVKSQGGVRPSLFKAIFRCFGWSYIALGSITFAEEAVRVIQAIIMGELIQYFAKGTTVSRTEAYLYGAGMSLSAGFLAIFHHPYFYGVQRCAMQIRIGCCSLLYRKALRLNNQAMSQVSVGQIINLMSNDVNRFDLVVLMLHFLWVGPLQAIVVLIILWYVYGFGPSTLAGFGYLILLMPVMLIMGKLFNKFRLKIAVLTDKRVNLMGEIVKGMQVIKMYAWERPFAKLIYEARRNEIKKISFSTYLRAVHSAMFFSSGKIILFFTFMAYILTNSEPLTTKQVFVSISLYNAVRLVMTCFFPWAIQHAAESMVSVQRLEEFLLLEEIDDSLGFNKSSLTRNPEDVFINVDSIVAVWNPKTNGLPVLNQISFKVKGHQLMIVVGPVGSGKSSLLSLLLGELPFREGNVTLRGSVAFVSQQPWIYAGTVRQNIIFVQTFDPEKYEKVIRVCALEKDLQALPQGDRTIIGDRGVNLSGGQKARINLARALYYDADLYLLDDPLSAVDTAVAQHLFDKCINGYLRKKPRILVTHQVQFLPKADSILVLKDGKCIGFGIYNDLRNSGIDFHTLLAEKEQGAADFIETRRKRTFSDESATSGDHFMQSHTNLHHMKSSHDVNSSWTSSILSLHSAGVIDAGHVSVDKVDLKEELKSEGKVSWSVYWKYLHAGGNVCFLPLVALSFIVAQIAFNYSDVWLAYWSAQEEKQFQDLTELSNETLFNQSIFDHTAEKFKHKTFQHLYIYTGIIGSVIILGLFRAVLIFRLCIRASIYLHKDMFFQIIKTPMLFFDNNPVGRILNRFTKDMGTVDEPLPLTLCDFLECLLMTVGIIIVIEITNPWVILPILPLGILFLYLRNYFLHTSRDIKRLEGITRSPVFSHLSSSLHGLWTIRACNAQESVIKEFEVLQDQHTSSWFLFLTTSRWFAVRLDWLCVMFVTVVTFACLFASENQTPGSAGLALSYCVNLMGLFQWVVRQSAEVENQMTSVERILEYTKLPQEASSVMALSPPPNWPQHGIITFEGVHFQYSENDPYVLKNLYCCIRAREKVGIVGRTGAGKSSLLAALFRLAEPKGMIRIDGILTSDLKLHELRSKISIIPQDPTLFTGSVRKNLDPFEEHFDDDLWDALEKVHLKSAIEEMPSRLEAMVAEGGSNFSVGQRQLVCLARAILRQNQILIIDEATANVDPLTDSLIQQTIKQKFKHCTVMTIAHRLNTVMDSDRIMVLDTGRIKEFDEPYTLLQNENSLFYQMVEQTGQASSEFLLNIAKQAYLIRNQPDPEMIITINSGVSQNIPSVYIPVSDDIVAPETVV